MTVKRLLLHVGDFKTGSTSIQVCLENGWFTAPDTTVLIPKSHNHIRLAVALRKGRSAKKMSADIAAEIRASDADVAILSAEHFQMVGPERLMAWVETHLPELARKTHVLCYVRPHAERLLSVYSEQTKLGVTEASLDDFVDHYLSTRRHRLLRRYAKWQKIFKRRLILRPFLRSELKDGDAVTDFLHYAVSPGARPTRPVETNLSLSARDLVLMRRFNKVLRWFKVADGERRGMANLLHAELSKRPELARQKLGLLPDQLDRLRDFLERDAAKVDARFFDGEPLSQSLRQHKAIANRRPPGPVPTWRHISAVCAMLLKARKAAKASEQGRSPLASTLDD